MKERLKNLGFDNVGEVLTEDIPFEPSLIDLCKMNTCGNYGKNHACPPLVGDTKELIKKAKSYKKAVVFQKIYKLEDSFDFEGMMKGKNDFSNQIQKVYNVCVESGERFVLLGAGGCTVCKTCAALDSLPCRFPERAIASLESYSVQVSALAPLCNMKYINGQNTVTYFGAVFCD